MGNTSLFGLFIGLILISAGMFDYEKMSIPSAFLNFNGLLIVLGGTLSATLVNYSMKELTIPSPKFSANLTKKQSSC
jgi:chemotaxis protein MotA